MVEKGSLLYEGKAKKLYKTNDSSVLWVEYKDEATAFNGEKKEKVSGKGSLTNIISSELFAYLRRQGVQSHFIEQVSPTEQLIKPLSMIPLEVVVRFVAAGSLSKRLGIPEGEIFPQPIIEFYYKNDELGDPLLTEDHLEYLELLSPKEYAKVKVEAIIIFKYLQKLCDQSGLQLIDGKLEFGRTEDGSIMLGDEISPDTCRFWRKGTKERLDKDVFRLGTGDMVSVYEEFYQTIKGVSAHV
ncbi:phosphoribosylaminoimidazolesuccinocarboxamide synthase [Mangrovibacillus cuniculi]|uniref:phosphoribosylaminoimidazolesuccinocarboxamide synthase n=1 Tax=Mangrovibacillus cuniculi TaxID=2593652 RepID=UPI0023BA6A90|nr:phosphoribosylaminoimidazolesuccinocarboxamide synthase [Mangrovibacillus cuniculi]